MNAKHTAKTPAPRSTARRAAAAQRQRVAAGIVAGKSVTAIAREEGVSRAWASKLVNSPEVAHIIGSLIHSELATVHQLFVGSLNAIADSFHAERLAVVQGKTISLGPDHFARLTGVKRFLEFVTTGRCAPIPEVPLINRRITLEEIETAYILRHERAEREEQEARKGIR